jgi:hypothetical protein
MDKHLCPLEAAVSGQLLSPDNNCSLIAAFSGRKLVSFDSVFLKDRNDGANWLRRVRFQRFIFHICANYQACLRIGMIACREGSSVEPSRPRLSWGDRISGNANAGLTSSLRWPIAAERDSSAMVLGAGTWWNLGVRPHGQAPLSTGSNYLWATDVFGYWLFVGGGSLRMTACHLLIISLRRTETMVRTGSGRFAPSALSSVSVPTVGPVFGSI